MFRLKKDIIRVRSVRVLLGTIWIVPGLCSMVVWGVVRCFMFLFFLGLCRSL